MKKVRIKCPAKINLTLEVVNKRDDGFHNIKSIMQMINLYDYLTISVEENTENKITLSGTSDELPYDENNIVYKAALLYLKEAGINNLEIKIDIEKNIPIAAGLAGGSTDAAGTIFGLNILLEKFEESKLEELCAQLGSDLNVCLKGGCLLATSRGEITQKVPVRNYPVTLIKPKNLGISAGYAYKKYAAQELKPQNNMTENMFISLMDDEDIKEYLYNDLENAIFDEYEELKKIKEIYPNSLMSGSGSTYFVLENISKSGMDEDFLFINNLKFIPDGVSLDE